MSQPYQLLEFPHSHYCEKARWALDYKGIAFKGVAILPGWHMFTVRRHAKKTSLPVLLNQRTTIQGSSEIIDYLDTQYPMRLLTPTDSAQRQSCLALERDMDQRLGVNIRLIMYDKLLNYPAFVQHCFTHTMPRWKQGIFKLTYPFLCQKIYQTYVVDDAQVERAQRDFKITMDELACILADKHYLVGEQFTRADLTVAALLSFLALPTEHPFPWQAIPDPSIQSMYEDYRDHPVTRWVSHMYQEHRQTLR